MAGLIEDEEEEWLWVGVGCCSGLLGTRVFIASGEKGVPRRDIGNSRVGLCLEGSGSRQSSTPTRLR